MGSLATITRNYIARQIIWVFNDTNTTSFEYQSRMWEMASTAKQTQVEKNGGNTKVGKEESWWLDIAFDTNHPGQKTLRLWLECVGGDHPCAACY